MRLKNYGTFLIGLFFYLPMFAQHEADNWRFNRFGLKFTSDTVHILTEVPVVTPKGMGIISDSTGQLLFYSDGITVWNKNHVQMPNGNNICYHSSRCLIIPKPDSDNLFYIFSVLPYSPVYTSGFFYSVVDMTLDNGLGDVTEKENFIFDTISNKITAVYHENLSDIWVITHRHNSNTYYAFLISNDGVSLNPVISTGGNNTSSSYDAQIKASPDGRIIVSGYNNWTSGEGFDLFEFNKSTGELYNPMVFATPSRGITGVDFSSDATNLYVFQSGSEGESTLFQYDVSVYDYDQVNDSRVTLLHPNDNGFRDLQLAPNGKIYITKGGGQFSGTKYLGVINSPNVSGLACNVEELGLYLEGETCQSMAPVFIQDYFYRTDFEVVNTCYQDSTFFYVTNLYRLDSVLWDFGDGQYSRFLNPVHSYSSPQDYHVNLLCYYPEKVDTISKVVKIHELPVFDLGNDTTVCSGYVIDLADYDFLFTWPDGTTNNFYIPDTSGRYWAMAQNEHGCIFFDTIHLVVNPIPYFSLGNDTAICSNTGYLLGPDTINPDCSYLWNTGSTDAFISIDSTGNYSLKVTSSQACTFVDSIFIETLEPPIVNLGNDTTIDKNSFLQLDAGYFGYQTNYLWDNYQMGQYRFIYGNVMDTGMHIFYVRVTTQNGCSGSDTIRVNIKGSSSIAEHQENSFYSLIPNPCNDHFTVINRKPGFTKNRSIEVFNSLGQLMLSKAIIGRKNKFDASTFESGIYWLIVFENSKATDCLKLIVK